jgi:hypothetical protein
MPAGSSDVDVMTDSALAQQLFRFQEIAALAQAAGVASASEATAWLTALGAAGAEERFFAAMTFFFVTGRKP